MDIAEKGITWTDQQRIAFLLEAARRFGSSLDEQFIYSSLVKLLADAMPVDGLIVSSFDPELSSMNCEFLWSDGQSLDVSEFPPVKWNRDGTGMQSKVILTGRAEIFDVPSKVREPNTIYLQVGPDGEPAPVTDEPATKIAMMAPMTLEGQVTGVVQLMSDREGAYNANDLSVFEAVVLQMTPAWHHARLFKKSDEDRRLIDRIVSTSPDLIYIFDLRINKSTYSNGLMARMLGYTPEEFSSMSFSEMVHPDDLERLPAIWSKFEEATDGETVETEYRIRNKTGEWRWFLNLDTPFERDADGRVVRVLGFGRDITSRKELEADLERRVAMRTAELEAAVTELEGFTYSVSHDLRAPLRAISAASMILREDYSGSLPPDAQQHLLRQAESAKRMGTLIDDLLKLSRLGRQELSPVSFDLSALAAEAAQELKGQDRVTITPGMKAFGDPRLVRFVLLNLIENGLKFSPEEGTVEIGTEDGAFFVADQGIGFDMSYAAKLFRPFERLVRDDEYPGTGIGLANAHRIVQRHGGRIWAESESGIGSTFFFTLSS